MGVQSSSDSDAIYISFHVTGLNQIPIRVIRLNGWEAMQNSYRPKQCSQVTDVFVKLVLFIMPIILPVEMRESS